MLDYRFTPLKQTDKDVLVCWKSDTSNVLDFKMRVSWFSNSYILAYINAVPKYIFKGNQECVIEEFNNLLNGGEINFLKNADKATKKDIMLYAHIN